jgi:DNA polymerase-3 subunit gamma/tau
LLGGVLVPRIGAAVTGTSLQSEPDALRTTMLVAIVASIFVALGAVGLITLIWWVEGQIARRRAGQLADAPPAEPSAPPATVPDLVEPLATRSAFAATGAGSSQDAEAGVAEASPATTPAVDTTSPPQFSLPRVESPPPPDVPVDDTWALITAQREEAARVETAPAAAIEAAPMEAPPTEAPPLEAPSVEGAVPEPAPPPEPEAGEAPSPPPARSPETSPPAEVATPRAETGPPHLTIKVGPKGMITAEMDGEAEHIILDDLTAYAHALAKVEGTAAIRAVDDDPMASLIARRAQRILDDAGVQVTVD